MRGQKIKAMKKNRKLRLRYSDHGCRMARESMELA